MSNVMRLFANDMKRATQNVVTIIIVVGLIFLPSIFCWYNILGCWDVFNNTGGITVAVANSDEGYDSDLMPITVNIGDEVVSALRANDQINWTFTDEDDAIDGAKSGRYYAAVVIPSSFSRDMMTFFSEDAEHAHVVYYTNEKKNAIAPKVTDQASSRIAYQVNQTFEQTIAEIALRLVESLSSYLDQSGADSELGRFASHVDVVSGQMADTGSTLRAYGNILASTRDIVTGSSDLLGATVDAASTVRGQADRAADEAGSIGDAVKTSSEALGQAFASSSTGYEGTYEAIRQAFDSADALSSDTASSLRTRGQAVQSQADAFARLAQSVREVEERADEPFRAPLEALAIRIDESAAIQQDLADALEAGAERIEAGDAEAQGERADIEQMASEASASVEDLAAAYNDDIKPRMDELASEVAQSAEELDASVVKVADAASDLSGRSASLTEQLDEARRNLDAAAGQLDAAASRLENLSAQMLSALDLGDNEQLKAIFESNTASLVDMLTAPVELVREEVFPAATFGTQMAPLYTTLAIWIGSLLLSVAIKVQPSEKQVAELKNPKPRHLFFGRFGVFAVVSLCQTTVLALGNIFFLGMEIAHPFLYLLCLWETGIVCAFFIYTCVVAFANLGKAIGVLLLILQVTAANGSYPLQLLPPLFTWLSPYVPATHAISAMRAAMFGLFQNDFWIEMGELALFIVPALLLGLALRKPTQRFVAWYVRKVESSKLVA